MTELVALRNHIIFQFESEQTRHMGSKQFEEKTDWGLTFVRVDSSTKSARWGTAKILGPECSDEISVGSRILIDALRWSEGFDYEGERYWRTDSNQILLA